jgi:hypothetical protein
MGSCILIVKVGDKRMFTIIQQGEQDNQWYTVQYNGKDVEHYTSLESAAMAVEDLKESFNHLSTDMYRWYIGDNTNE